jgi:hypothetical protein
LGLAWRKTERLGVPELFALLGLASFLAARYLPLLELAYPCPFRAATGFPCASCGMTHAFVHLARGELAAALGANPLGAVLAGAAWLYSALDLARAALRLPWPVVPERVGTAAARAGIAALALNWAWLVWRAAA